MSGSDLAEAVFGLTDASDFCPGGVSALTFSAVWRVAAPAVVTTTVAAAGDVDVVSGAVAATGAAGVTAGVAAGVTVVVTTVVPAGAGAAAAAAALAGAGAAMAGAAFFWRSARSRFFRSSSACMSFRFFSRSFTREAVSAVAFSRAMRSSWTAAALPAMTGSAFDSFSLSSASFAAVGRSSTLAAILPLAL